MKKLHIYTLAVFLLLIAVAIAQINDSVIINSTGRVVGQSNVNSNLWIAAVPISSGQIGLSWRLSADPTIVGYNLYRSTSSGTAYAKLTSSPISTTSYVDSGLANGQTYFYVAKVVFSNGTESSASREVYATATSTSSNFYVYRTIGNSEHPAFHSQTYDSRTGPRYYIASVSVGDLNADGMVDYVAWQKGANAHIVAFLHDGTFLWEAPFNIQGGGHNTHVVVGDVDGDGFGEVVSHDDYKYVRIRDGLTGAIKRSLVLERDAFENRANVALADLNGNGERDAIIVHYNSATWRWSLKAFGSNLNLIWEYPYDPYSGHFIKVEDLDEDGRDEILIGGADFVDDDGTRIPVDHVQSDPHVDGIAVGDFDWTNPGLEVVFAGCHGEHVWMVNSQGKLMWDHLVGHAHWASMGDFDPTYDGLEAFVSFGDARQHYIFYADGHSSGPFSLYDDTQPTLDWDGDWSNGDELHPIRNFNDVRITNAHTGQTQFSFGGRSSGSRGVDVIGDYREEFIWPDIANRRIVIFSNADLNSDQFPSKWDDSYWRLQSKYKRSFASEYVNGALVY